MNMKLINQIKVFLTTLILLLGLNALQAQDKKVQEFEIEGLSCGACANTAKRALSVIAGVDSAAVDFQSKKAVVYASRGISQKKIEEVVSSKNFEAVFPGEELVKPLTGEQKKGLDIATIKGGKKLSFSKHLAAGKITIFDFYADWCGPCKIYSPKLENLLQNDENLALRKVDVVDWKSDLAKQLTKDYKVPALPFTLIFNEKGELAGRVEGNNIEAVEALVKKIK
jgi:thiol-disulfide isomerase/thioredoxin